MITEFAKNWWALVLRGIMAVLLGVLALTRPGITLVVLIALVGSYLLIDGALAVAGAMRASRAGEPWGPLLIEGVVDIGAGLAIFSWPALTLFALVVFIGCRAVVKGILEVVTAIRLRKVISGEWLLALGGVVSIIFGVMVVMAPIAGAIVLAWWVGGYAFVFGLVLITLGFRLRRWTHHAGLGGPAVHAH